MKKLLGTIAFSFLSTALYADDVLGKWKSAANEEGQFIIMELANCDDSICGDIVEVSETGDQSLVGKKDALGYESKRQWAI